MSKEMKDSGKKIVELINKLSQPAQEKKKEAVE